MMDTEIGKTVYFTSWPDEGDAQLQRTHPAVVCDVYLTRPPANATEEQIKAFVPKTLVNLAVFDSLGSVRPKVGVPFYASEGPKTGYYALGSLPPPPVESASGDVIPPAEALYDADLNAWTLAFGVVKMNGKPVGTTSQVTALLYFEGYFYAESASGWQEWINGAWVTTTDPRIVVAPPESVPVAPPPVTPPATTSTNNSPTLTVPVGEQPVTGLQKTEPPVLVPTPALVPMPPLAVPPVQPIVTPSVRPGV